MNESEKQELRAIRQDIVKRDKEVRKVLLELRESLKRSEKATGRQALYMVGLTAMVVGMELTRVGNTVSGLVIFVAGFALCLSIISPIYRVYRAAGLKIKLNKLSQYLFSDR